VSASDAVALIRDCIGFYKLSLIMRFPELNTGQSWPGQPGISP
jgi:hypothetical protein